MNKYPKWFFADYPPRKPDLPVKTVTKYDVVEKMTISNYMHYNLTKFPDGADCLSFEVHHDYYHETVDSIDLIFSKTSEVPNPKLKEQTKYYNEKLKEYNTQYEEWSKIKEQWDEDQKTNATKEKAARQKLYLKLKKEFEK